MKFFKKIFWISFWIGIVNHLINVSFRRQNSFLENLLDAELFITGYIYSFVILIAILFFFQFLDKKLSWETQGILKLIIGIIGSVVVVIPTFFLLKLIHSVAISQTESLSEFLAKERWQYYVFTVIYTLAVTFFFMMIGFLKALQKEKINTQKMIAQTATAKFTVLKNQLDPHFLFNSLNVLTSLIEENPSAAQKFTTSLSKVYRYVLEQKNKDLISIKEEIKFAKTYMSLLQMRFENSIFLEIAEDVKDIEAKIVPLSLQLLLENTIKHNITSVEKPLKVKIFTENGFLHVTNNLQPKTIIKTETGVGLVNIKERYQIMTKKEFSTEKTADKFIAKLPIIS